MAVPEVFAKVNLVQLPSREFDSHIEQNSSRYGARSVLTGTATQMHFVQGSYRSWKTWKVVKFKNFIFQALKVMES